MLPAGAARGSRDKDGASDLHQQHSWAPRGGEQGAGRKVEHKNCQEKAGISLRALQGLGEASKSGVAKG